MCDIDGDKIEYKIEETDWRNTYGLFSQDWLLIIKGTGAWQWSKREPLLRGYLMIVRRSFIAPLSYPNMVTCGSKTTDRHWKNWQKSMDDVRAGFHGRTTEDTELSQSSARCSMQANTALQVLLTKLSKTLTYLFGKLFKVCADFGEKHIH